MIYFIIKNKLIYYHFLGYNLSLSLNNPYEVPVLRIFYTPSSFLIIFEFKLDIYSCIVFSCLNIKSIGFDVF